MTSTLSILGREGDTRLTWDPADPADCARARETVAALKLAGFSFFLTNNHPADEISGGSEGTLVVCKLTADEVVAPEPEPEPEAAEATPEILTSAPKRRGRPPKAQPTGAKNVVAVRPVRGG
jgi:hypothetical protein